jgi:hypothetical protein
MKGGATSDDRGMDYAQHEGNEEETLYSGVIRERNAGTDLNLRNTLISSLAANAAVAQGTVNPHLDGRMPGVGI